MALSRNAIGKGSIMDDSLHAVPREPNRRTAVGDSVRPAAITVEAHAHVAAAAYLMQRAHATELMVITNDANRRHVAVITDADIAQAVADGRDINDLYIDELVPFTPWGGLFRGENVGVSRASVGVPDRVVDPDIRADTTRPRWGSTQFDA
jgi:hypothetical protein